MWRKFNRIQRIVCFLLFSVTIFIGINWQYQIVSFNPSYIRVKPEIRVLTWNVHCPDSASLSRQRKIADLIIAQDADFVQLNEFKRDDCLLVDSLLKRHYKYSEEEWANKHCGDIFYSNIELCNSGHILIPVAGHPIPSIAATIPVDGDSVFIIGVHLASNSGDGSAIVNGLDSLKKVGSFYERYKERQADRNYSMMWIKRWIKERALPTIVMGDMNDFNCSAPLDSLTDIGLTDSWWEGGTGYGCTFHTGWMQLRIDHVFHSKELKLTGIRVIDTELSDHNPIVADFKIH